MLSPPIPCRSSEAQACSMPTKVRLGPSACLGGEQDGSARRILPAPGQSSNSRDPGFLRAREQAVDRGPRHLQRRARAARCQPVEQEQGRDGVARAVGAQRQQRGAQQVKGAGFGRQQIEAARRRRRRWPGWSAAPRAARPAASSPATPQPRAAWHPACRRQARSDAQARSGSASRCRQAAGPGRGSVREYRAGHRPRPRRRSPGRSNRPRRDLRHECG